MSRARFILLSLFLDALIVNVGFLAAFIVRFMGWPPAFNLQPYFVLAPLITVAYLVANYIYGVYEPERTESTWQLARAVASGSTIGVLLTLAMLYIAGPGFASFPRTVLAIAWPLQILLLVGWRFVFLRVSSVTWPTQRVILIGSGSLTIDLAHELQQRSKWGYRVLGLVEPSRREECSPPTERDGFPVLGCVDEIASIVAAQRANRIIVVSPVALRELVESLALADESQVRIDVVPELYEIFIGTVDTIVGDVPLMEITRPTVPPYFAAAKRAADIVFAALLLIILSPVLVLAALAILLSMGTPVLYSQERVGKNLKPFNVLKFRTMVRDAEKLSGPVLATDDDPRITPVGRILRRYRIDELPQLFNILVGDMSFVGPRPERPYFVEQYIADIPGYRERFHVKPGVTGLAQVSGGYATTPERKLKYDLIYMYHQDLIMDLQIVLETLRVVLTGRGAR